MSVIMGYKTEEKIYLGADNRTSTEDDIPIRDNVNKIVVVNNNVAVAFAGYGGTQTIFESMTKNIRSDEDFRVEDAFRLLTIIYWIYKLLWYTKASKNAFSFGSRFIIAGKNRKDEYCMYTMSILRGKLEKPSLTDKFLFPPYDVSPKVCWDIYTKNVINSYSDFMQRTVKEIASISKVVSPSGDIWIYDLSTDISITEHFC